MSVLSSPYFHNEEAAYGFVENIIWTDGKSCPHCGGVDRITSVKANPTKRIRIGLWRCGDCKRQFTIKVGTIFEHMRIPLHKALQATYLIASSKKGISAHQIHRTLGITYKTAWFLIHRIREAMREGELDLFGTDGGIVEVDETFIGNDLTMKPKGERKGRGYAHKHKLLSLVDRTSGKARSMVVDSLKANDLLPILEANIAKEAHVMTDEAGQYYHLRKTFSAHDFTSHGKGEYVRGNIHTNTIEGYFSIFKRGMKGIYQHCAKKHLHRYAAEFQFRYNHRDNLGCNDNDRTAALVRGIIGKRLLYRAGLVA